jgi:membrane protein YdbS with pleckstrin-like domain
MNKKSNPTLTITPQFIFSQHFSASLLCFAIASCFCYAIFPQILLLALFSLIASLAISFYVKILYKKTKHEFFSDRLSYSESFLNQYFKEISYKKINEAQLVKGVWQRSFGLGTIILTTSATGNAGVRIVNIENLEENYQKIRYFLKNHSEKK